MPYIHLVRGSAHLNLASLTWRRLQPAAKWQQQQSQHQRQHRGKGNSLKITILGFQDKPLLRETFQPQFWLCNNKSNSHWAEARTRHMRSASKHSPVPLTPSQPSACQPMSLKQKRWSHLFFGGGGWESTKRRKAPSLVG